MSARSPAPKPTRSPTAEDRRDEILAAPGFGLHFTDHMVLVEWTPEQGWHDARVQPYGPLSLDPATAVLHYAQEIFEGMKAYPHADGSVWTFRPEVQRRALPALRAADGAAASCRPRRSSRRSTRWSAPTSPGSRASGETSLYLRPFMFASEVFLGVRPADARDVLRDRVAGRPVLPRRAEAGVDLAVARTTPGPRPVAPARPSAAATTPRAWPRSRRRPRTAAPRWPSSTRPSAAGSRSSAA